MILLIEVCKYQKMYDSILERIETLLRDETNKKWEE